MKLLSPRSTLLARAYNALWYPALPFLLVAAGGLDRAIWRARLGRINQSELAAAEDPIDRVWVHAASVGEIEAVRPVLRRLGGHRRTEVILTSMTIAGREAARRRIPELSSSRLAPFDFAPAVRRFLSFVRPRLILIAETELWPNFFDQGFRAGARIAIINGRLSARSMRRYRMIRRLIGRALGQASQILVQTALDADRFVQLGAPPERVIVTGNTKFDLDDGHAPLRRALQDFARGRPILVAGSTAPGEEREVVRAYRQLLDRFPDLALTVAPRHLEQIPAAEAELRNARLNYVRASALEATEGCGTAGSNVLLLDTLGELRAFYDRAAIAFVGGSMAPRRGGQSLAEPAAARVPVLFGPHYQGQQEIGDALIKHGAGAVVRDGPQLAEACCAWLADARSHQAAGQQARRVLERLAGGAARTVEHLNRLLNQN